MIRRQWLLVADQPPCGGGGTGFAIWQGLPALSLGAGFASSKTDEIEGGRNQCGH